MSLPCLNEGPWFSAVILAGGQSRRARHDQTAARSRHAARAFAAAGLRAPTLKSNRISPRGAVGFAHRNPPTDLAVHPAGQTSHESLRR